MKEEAESEVYGGRSFSFKYSQRYGWKLLGYFNHEDDIREFVKQNNLQIGDRISRKIENDQLACKVLPHIFSILLGKDANCPQHLRDRICAGKNLRKRFYRLLEEHRVNVDWQLNSEMVIPTNRMRHQESIEESAMA